MLRRGLLILLLAGAGLLGIGGAALLARGRMARCAALPLLAEDRLPPIDFGRLEPAGPAGVALPAGWSASALGVQVGNFTVSGAGHSFQLIGIANALQTPPVAVRAGSDYCVAAQAIVDSTVSSARIRAAFQWLDARGRPIALDWTGWQPVRRWEGSADHGGWSIVGGAFRAPDGADRLAVSFHPSSDDRIYLDDLHVRPGLAGPRPLPQAAAPATLAPWPDGRAAALSFSFDWETAMGGLIHSRSVDDPNSDQDPLVRAMRMRQGVTTTLELFRPYGIRATYYANGYNFLLGNAARRTFMNNPTFAWADSQKPHSWPTDHWKTAPWFSPDPYGTVASDPQWYFGDLVPMLQNARQDIQSHTFSHFYGGFATPAEWQADLAAWPPVAAERGVAPARSLAFPWSGSGGMTDESWDALAAAGITSVTRTSKQAQYEIASERDPHCRPIPGHERILACPDFYLHSAESAAQALKLIDRTIAVSGTLDLWAHTEEVVAPDQIAAWGQVVGYAAQQRDAGRLWIAPLAEIADWQQALAQVTVTADGEQPALDGGALTFRVTNASARTLNGLTLNLPFAPARAAADGQGVRIDGARVILDAPPGQSLEVAVWPG